MDDPDPNSISRGYNFRYASYYYLPDIQNTTTGQFREYRDLLKVFGRMHSDVVSERSCGVCLLHAVCGVCCVCCVCTACTWAHVAQSLSTILLISFFLSFYSKACDLFSL